MLIRNTLSITVLMMTVVLFGKLCIAGTWYDDFSDRTSEDWGPLEFMDDFFEELSIGIKKGSLNFRGKKEKPNFGLQNWRLGEIHDFSLEMKFMFRHFRVPEECYWAIDFGAQNQETGEWEGIIDFSFHYLLGVIVDPNVAYVSISSSVQEPERRLRTPKKHAGARFAFEEGIWYTLRIEAHGNRYIFWVENLGLEIMDDSVPGGWIGLHFVGRFNLWLDDFTVTGPTVPDGGPGSLRAVLASDKLTTTWGRLKVRD